MTKRSNRYAGGAAALLAAMLLLTGCGAKPAPADTGGTAPAAESGASATAAGETQSATQDTGTTATSFSVQDVPVFVPNDSGLTQYTLAGETADAAALVEMMAEYGAFPADVTLEALDESGGTVRLQFSGALQTYLNDSTTAASLEAISKTFRAFYEAAGRSVDTLEVYAAGEPVTVGGVAIDCTALMYGELPVSGVVENP